MRFPSWQSKGRPPRPKVDAPPGERMLAWAELRSGQGIVRATDQALHLPHPPGSGIAARLRWDEIVRAAWEDPVVVLVVSVQGRERTVRLALQDASSVPEVVYERVTSTIEVDVHVPLDQSQSVADRNAPALGAALNPGRGVRVVGRRHSETGELRWELTFDQGIDPGDPVWRSRADAALADLRSNLGL